MPATPIKLFRGGMPDFKGWFCDGQFAEFTPPFDAPHAKFTPPFDSHADAAHGQGYLNLHFPLVPNLNDTVGHRWMQYGLKGVKADGDVILTNGGAYPPDLIIGRVVAFCQESHGISSYASVEPVVDFSGLSTVLVIKEFHVEN